MRKTISVLLSILMAASCVFSVNFSAFALSAEEMPEDLLMTLHSEYNVAPGISEEHFTTVLPDGSVQNESYVATIDFTKDTVGALAGYMDYDSEGEGHWGMQTVRDQAKAAEKATGKNIVVAVNADYFNMTTGEPLNTLIMHGKTVKDATSGWLFGITKDGVPVLREGTDHKEDLVEAVGAPFALVQNGEIVVAAGGDRMPRAAIGITEDGKVKTMVNDGRQSPKSTGFTLYETAAVMLAMGCKDALYLDGGGSATFCTKSEGTDVLTVKNSPSDGTERRVSDTLFFYSTAAPSGVFDHAALSPRGDYYTRTCDVQFSAIGVDGAGGAAALPEEMTFALADETMGSIDPITGLFTSSGVNGTVVVKAMSGGEEIGSTQIEVRDPDMITFTNDEVSLGFGDSNTLGLEVKAENVNLHFTEQDIVWNTVNDDPILDTRFEYNGKKVIYFAGDGYGIAGNEAQFEEDYYYYELIKVDIEGKATTVLGIGDALTAEEKDDLLDDLLGHFEGNTFISAEVNSFNGYAVARSAYDENVTGSIRLIIGKKPTVVMDFEDYEDEDGNVTSAKDYWTLTTGTCEPSGGTITSRVQDDTRLIWVNYNRLAKGNAEIVGIDDGQVRFGSHALKINFDFSEATGTEGACIGFTEATKTIEGLPTGIGVWVYAPEGTPNLWLRMRFKDGDGVVQTINFKDNNPDPAKDAESLGICFSGWKYMEASLAKFKGPFSLIGGESFRPMYLLNSYGTKAYINGEAVPLSRAEQKGSIYIDNVQFVYGANTDDVDNPYISSMQANFAEIENGTTIDSNKISFQIGYADVENRYMTGVNPDSIAVYLDGKDITSRMLLADSTIRLEDMLLSNGSHSLKVKLRDNFNNETVETRTFNVSGNTPLTSASLVGTTEAPILGKDFVLAFESNNIADVKALSAELSPDSEFADDMTVQFADGFTGTVTKDEKTSAYILNAERTEDPLKEGDNSILRLTFPIAYDTKEGKNFVYSLTNGVVECFDQSAEGYEGTFSQPRTSLAVKQELDTVVGTMIAGAENGEISVKDEEGYGVIGAKVFADGELIGTTGKGGIINTDALCDEVQTYSVYAEKDGRYSFADNGQTLNAAFGMDNASYDVIVNATSDPETGKNITWLSSPVATLDESVVLYAEKAEYEKNGNAALKRFDADSMIYTFTGSSDINSNYAVKINSAVLTGLKRNTEYVFKVGDTSRYCGLRSFTTSLNGKATNFFVIGDTQTEDKANTDAIFDLLSSSGVKYDFGIQTGDSVESANVYGDWIKNLDLYNGEFMSGVDIVHVLGNHEYMGDLTGSAANAIYNTPSDSVYSAQYGNVYVATMVYSNNKEEIAERLEWIRQDSAKSTARWKILTMHQPPYYTNITSPSDEMNELVPPVVEEAGFDMVLSGHDHTYARTEPLKGGEVDAEDGVIYMICGTTGGKSYSATDNEAFHFVTATNDFNAIYSTFEATDNTLTVKVNELDPSFNSSVRDEFTINKPACTTHSFAVSDDDYLACTVCGHCEQLGKYTGVASDPATGVKKYYVLGTPVADQWVTNGADSYYIGKDGLALTGEQTIDGKTYTFAEDGKFVKGCFVDEEVTMNDGTVKTITRYYIAGGVFALKWVEIDGALYHFKKQNNATKPDDGAMFKDGKYKITTPGKNTARKFTFDEEGKLITGAFESETNSDGTYKGTRYYWGDSYVTEPQIVNGVTYTFDENGYVLTKDIAECEITLDSEAYTFNGIAVKPVVTVKCGEELLKKGTNYSVAYSENKAIGTGKVTVTGLEDRGFTGSVELTFAIDPAIVTGLTAAATGNADVTLSWNAAPGATRYSVYRSSGKSFKFLAKTNEPTFVDASAKAGVPYSYKIKTVAVVGDQTLTSELGDEVTITPVIGKVTLKSATAKSYNSVTVKWAAVSGASGYTVFRATSKNGSYKKIAAVTGKTSYTDTACKTGTKYYYKVSAYVTVDGVKLPGEKSAAKSATAALSAVKVSLKSRTASSVTLKWTKAAGANGYVIYKASKTGGKLTKVATVKGGSKLSYAMKDLKAASSRYIVVKAYRTVDGKDVLSPVSNYYKATTL